MLRRCWMISRDATASVGRRLRNGSGVRPEDGGCRVAVLAGPREYRSWQVVSDDHTCHAYLMPPLPLSISAVHCVELRVADHMQIVHSHFKPHISRLLQNTVSTPSSRRSGTSLLPPPSSPPRTAARPSSPRPRVPRSPPTDSRAASSSSP